MTPSAAPRPTPLLEVAVGSSQDAQVAFAAGAHRVECNGSLGAHGRMPTPEMVTASAAAAAYASINPQSVSVVALLRPASESWPPTSADDPASRTHLLHQARDLLASGARGLVFGSLDRQQHLNERHTRALADLCAEHHAEATVHRALEECSDPLAELHRLARWGVHRVLLAGFPLSQPHLVHSPDRPARLHTLAAHAAQCGLIPALCGGIRPANVRSILGPCLIALPASARMQVHSACTDAAGHLDAAAIAALADELRRPAGPA